MLSTIQFDISNELAIRLQPLQSRISEILELGLREFNAKKSFNFEGFSDVLEFLAGLPSPDEIINLRPSDKIEARINHLLEKNRVQGLTPEENIEWEQYQYIEHLVRIAKAKAHLKLKNKGQTIN
ncbi:MAG: hypothetical protein HQK70_11100 [Desulfamplus sp.]|nr:hypothetical protein [Desulfamplus sp.]